MKQNKAFLYYSLLASLVCYPDITLAGIRVGNLSRNNAQGYQQVNAMRFNTSPNSVVTQQVAGDSAGGVSTTDTNAAQSGRATDAVDAVRQEKCAMIYPDGMFEWTVPTIGRGAGGASTCTAVVEMRAFQAGPNGGDLVVARANLPAGESIRCNISDFPEHSLLPAAGEIEFPADAEPTIEDVVKVMNQEQKQDAGLKIAAGAVLFGVAGNMIGKNEPGKNGLLGGGKDKLTSTAIGALGGAALMVGHTQTGKVAGDTILSAGVNASAGAVVGNMVATGDTVLRIEDCIVDGRKTTCVWGLVARGKKFTGRGSDGMSDNTDDPITKVGFYNIRTEDTYVCDVESSEGKISYKNCSPRELISISLGCENGKSLDDLQKINFNGYCTDDYRFELKTPDSYDMSLGRIMQPVDGNANTETTFIKIDSAKIAERKEPAMIADVSDKAFGYKRSDWGTVKKGVSSDRIYLRNNKNEGYRTANMEYSLDDFYPIYRNAEDGALVDFGNKARLKSTLTGAGIGGVMGAFAGYQGAKQDVEERWVSAVREYNDSLAKIYCATGTRFLAQYNDVATIPALVMPEQ